MDRIIGTQFTSLSHAFVTWDEEQKLVSWTDSCTDYWYDPEAILRVGLPMLELIEHLANKGVFGLGDPMELAQREFARVKAAGFNSTDEIEMIDGRVIRIQRAALNDGGHASTYTDITQEVDPQTSLMRNETFLRYVINQMPDVFVLKDEKGDFMLCNEVVATLYNTTPEEMVGKHDDDFGVPKDMADHFRRNVLGIMERGETEIVYEDSRDAKTGKVHHFKSIKKPFLGPDGKKRIIVIAQDITELITIQNQLKEDTATLQGVLEIINEGVWNWHLPSGKVTHNDEWYRLLGAKRGEISETVDAFSKLLHPDDMDNVMALLQDHLNGGTEHYESEHRMLRMDGSVIIVHDRGRVVERDNDGAPVRVIGSVREITELKRTVEELQRAKVEAETANRAKSEFLASMSHELRTPMNAILGFAQMLNYMSKTRLTETQLEYVNSIESAGGHLLQLINQILDLAKIEADELDLTIEMTNLQPLVRETLDLLRPLADEKGIALSFSNEENCKDIQIATDNLRLRQCVLNLISNAIKYNHPGGTVTVECVTSADKIRLSVADTGVGIPLEEHSEIFTMFYRLDVHSMKAKEGTGIGLNVTKLLIEKLGGSIGFQSEVGVGSVFWLEHPLNADL